MIRLAETVRGAFPVRVVVGRVLSVDALPSLPAAHDDLGPPDLSRTRLIVEQDDLVRELVLAHLQPIELPLHRSLTLVTGWEVEREWLLYVYTPVDKSHRRFDEHIRWFFSRQGADELGEADVRLLWSTVLLQVFPSGAL
ncbi:MAG: hypothetical protein DCF26_03850 [Burkholderiales bacterium]|nr:MAG: hypothetical protein DCF26_03850 [Burkholderiales bacterium]